MLILCLIQIIAHLFIIHQPPPFNYSLSSRTTLISAMPKRGASAANKTVSSKKYSRPGVEAAVHLLSLPISSERWSKILDRYKDMLKKKGGKTLCDLDERRARLADSLNDNKCITKTDLIDVIIPWKFAKGKPRHALKPLLNSNTDKSVENSSRRAIEIAASAITKPQNIQREQIKEAITTLCSLNGVGPATASAILSIFHPSLFAFMDDEIIEALYDGKRGYTFKIYEMVNEKCEEICTQLNTNGDKAWVRCEVGMSLWTVAAMKAFGEDDMLSELLKEDEADSSKRRKK